MSAQPYSDKEIAAKYHTYEFFLHPKIDGWDCRWCEIWTECEYEEAWTLLNARGYSMHEVERKRSEPMFGWPKPTPTTRNSEDEYRSGHTSDVGALLQWLRSGMSNPFPRPNATLDATHAALVAKAAERDAAVARAERVEGAAREMVTLANAAIRMMDAGWREASGPYSLAQVEFKKAYEAVRLSHGLFNKMDATPIYPALPAATRAGEIDGGGT